MRLRQVLVLCLFLFAAHSNQAQVRGIVLDAETGDTLPFAYILSQKTQKGSFSGLDGRFELTGLMAGDSLRVSLLGYFPQVVGLGSEGSVQRAELVIRMVPGAVSVGDVVITPMENPALRIMRNMVEHRNGNDPQQASHYRSETYNKLSAVPIYPASVPDSNRIRHYIFLTETVTRRYQIRPGKVQEEIVSSRLAGYPGRVIPFTASDLQDLSFYSNYVGVFGQQFLSPVSPPGLNQYTFILRDTVLAGNDSLFTIDFQPVRGNFDGFAGTLRVISGKWALLTVEANLVLVEPGILIGGGRIRQVNHQLDGGQWVPKELNTEIDTKPLMTSAFNFHFSGFSAFRNQMIGDSLRDHFRSEDALVVADGAGKEDSILKAGRVMPLDSVELETYQTLDSLGKLYGMATILDQFWKLADNRLMLGPVDVLLERILTNNQIEKTRIGLGLMTNEKLSRRFSVGGFGGWGWQDKRWKWGGTVQLTPLGDDRLYLGGSWSKDLVESGFRRLGIRPERGLHQDIYREIGIRNWYLKNMDYVETQEVWLGTRLPGDLGVKLAGRMEEVVPGYDYRFADSARYDFAEAEVTVRWAPGAEYAKNGNRRLLVANRAPVFLARYTRGLEEPRLFGAEWPGDSDYHGLAFSMVHVFDAFRGGNCAYEIQAGWNDRSLPRSRMRVYRSNFAKGNFTELPGAFNTMRYDEFAADMYVEGFLYVSPRLRWLHIGRRVQPRVHLSMAAAWGDLYTASVDLHGGVETVAPSMVYLEPGLTITHLLPAPKVDNFLFALIRSFGVGVYYRAGAYAFPGVKDNLAFRLSLGRI